MKKLFYLPLILLLLNSCGSNQEQSGIPTIDVTKTYPKKEIILQDIADVEYIPLETSDKVLLEQYSSMVYTSGDNIIIFNREQGDILFFDTKGKLSHKFNHKGQSGQEYAYMFKVFADEVNQDIFVIDGNSDRVQVYGFNGNYRRTLEVEKVAYAASCNFNKDEFIFYNNPNKGFLLNKKDKDQKQPEIVFVKNDNGKIDATIKIDVVKDVDAICKVKSSRGHTMMFIRRPADVFEPTAKGIVFNEIANDTTFLIKPNRKLEPLLIRSPQVSAAEEPLKMVGILQLTNDYIFFKVMQKKFSAKDRRNNFPVANCIWSKKEQQFFEYTLKNADVNELGEVVSLKRYELIQVDELKDLLEAGKLTGKLKTIAEKINDDDNPVLMKVTLK